MISLFSFIFCAVLTIISAEENVVNSTESPLDFSMALTNIDQQLLAALHEELDQRSNVDDKFNFYQHS